MKKIYLLKVMFNLNSFEHHFENVYSSIDLANQKGKEWLEYELRKEYNDWFEKDSEHDIPREELSKEQLFKLKIVCMIYLIYKISMILIFMIYIMQI